MFDPTVILAAASGLVLFLFGMEQFSREVQLVAGERFRSFIKKATDNPLKGAFLGASVTTIAQSSTAVAIISLGLIDSGLLSFTQSLSIFLGAGIGSTITAQLIALKITAIAPIFMLLGFAISVLGGRYKFIGRPIFFFGIVFSRRYRHIQ
jgi:phosphate:Na+ symporter